MLYPLSYEGGTGWQLTVPGTGLPSARRPRTR